MGQGITVGVDHGKDVKVKAVEGMLDVRINTGLPREAVRDVLGDHCADPLSRVDGPKEDNRRILPGARLPKEVDALDVPLFERLAGCQDS